MSPITKEDSDHSNFEMNVKKTLSQVRIHVIKCLPWVKAFLQANNTLEFTPLPEEPSSVMQLPLPQPTAAKREKEKVKWTSSGRSTKRDELKWTAENQTEQMESNVFNKSRIVQQSERNKELRKGATSQVRLPALEAGSSCVRRQRVAKCCVPSS